MLCCSPPLLTLTLVQLTPDFSNQELLSSNPQEVLRTQGKIHPLSAVTSLEIVGHTSANFRTGLHSSANFTIHLNNSSQELDIEEVCKLKEEADIWRVLGSGDSYRLSKGDRIKLGLTEFSVYTYSKLDKPPLSDVPISTKQACRYCLLSDHSLRDPLVSLCRCNGSVKYLHISCLRDWLSSKRQLDHRPRIVFHIFDRLECELCKTKWPLHFTFEHQDYDLLDFKENFKEQSIQSENSHLSYSQHSQHLSQSQHSQERLASQPSNPRLRVAPEEESVPFLVLKHFFYDEEEEQEMLVFIRIDMREDVRLGENDDNADLSLYTMGVSPLHCRIFQREEHIWVADLDSRTGTLVSLHKTEIFGSKSGLTLQINSTVLQIKAEEHFFSFFTPEVQFTINFKKRMTS